MIDEKELVKQAFVFAFSTAVVYWNLDAAVAGMCTVADKKILKFSISKLKRKSVLHMLLKHIDFSVFQNTSPTFLQECSQYNKEMEDDAKKYGVSYSSVYLLRDILLNSKYKKLVPLFDKHVSDLKKAVPFLINNLKFTFFNKILEEV
jgi:hypothetical protein